MLSPSKKPEDVVFSLVFVRSSDASAEYGGVFFFIFPAQKDQNKDLGLEPGLLLGEKPHSIDADLILPLSSLRYSPAPPALTHALIAPLRHLGVRVGVGSHNPSGWLDISPPPLFFSRENLLISAKLKSQT